MSAPSVPSLARVLDGVFEAIEADPRASGHSLPDEHLVSLHFFFDKILLRALKVVESGAVRCYVGAGSWRTVYQVQGSHSNDAYLVFPAHFCTCQSFTYDVVGKQEELYCKHQLAARISQALRLCPVIEVPDTELAQLLLSA